jgi:hypothetical protein
MSVLTHEPASFAESGIVGRRVAGVNLRPRASQAVI